MKTYDELLALIIQRGVHAEFGDAGEGFAIEQSPHELAVFLVRMQELGIQSVLEIGTGYKGGLSRFLAADMGWQVTSVDIQNYGHVFEGIHYVIGQNLAFETDEFDLVFIDGDHSFDCVTNDYMVHGWSARKVIAFHDISGQRDCKGVETFWNELTQTPLGAKHANEIGGNKLSGSAGIGWIEL